MDIQFINENQFLALEKNECSFGKSIEFPNNTNELGLCVHTENDDIDEGILSNLEAFANTIADRYDEFKQWVSEYILDSIEDDISIDEIIDNFDLWGISSYSDNPVFAYTISLGKLLDEDQTITVYHDIETDELVDLESDSEEDDEPENDDSECKCQS